MKCFLFLMPLVDVCCSEPWQLCVGGLQVQCSPRSQDGVDRLAVSRGLLTCCRRSILVSQVDTTGVCHRLLMLTDISSSFVLMGILLGQFRKCGF